jgi:ubiquinone/menaquinone biosynthesis C-methylase UbiE
MPGADRYTHGHHEAVVRAHRWRTADNSAAYLLSHLGCGARVLDVGCGPGTLTVDIAKRVAPGRVLVVDVSTEVIEQAQNHAAEVGGVNATFLVGDFRALDLEPRSFDVVHAHQVLQHLVDPVGALAAMAALARPGGLVAARDSDYAAFTWWPADESLDRWLAVYRAVTQRNGAEANAGRHLLGWARQAGLEDVAYTTSTWTFATAEDREWWAGLWAERTVATALAEQAVAYGIASPAELAEIAAGWRAWAEHPDGVFVVLHGEILARIS